MTSVIFDADAELSIQPSAGSNFHDFDFLAGRWDIRNRKLKTRLNECAEWFEFDAQQELRIILNGLGNTDNFKTTIDGKPFEGMTLRLFDPVTRLWSIYWADSKKGTLDPPVMGSFENNIGTFYGRDVWEGKEVIVKFMWNKTNAAQPAWSQAFSADNGQTWEWNWYMYFTRTD